MAKKASSVTLLLLISFLVCISINSWVFGLEPNEILIIANRQCAQSVELANYYCQKRHVPKENILALPLTWPASDTVSRADYVKKIAEPILVTLDMPRFSGKIKCFLMTYGMPIKIAAKPMEPDKQTDFEQLKLIEKKKTDQLAEIISQFKALGIENAPAAAPISSASVSKLLAEADTASQSAINRIKAISKGTQQKTLYVQWLRLYETIYGKADALKAALKYSDITAPPTANEQARQSSAIEGYILLLNDAERQHWTISQRIKKGYYVSLDQVVGIKGTLNHLQTEIDRLSGKETNAAVDSELSMVQFGDYELYRWQPNELKDRLFWEDAKTIMVSRLDGPGFPIVKGLIDKALTAEANGISGKAYFDLRCAGGIEEPYSPAYYDNSLLDAAELVKHKTKWPVIIERTAKLFGPNDCPQTAIYCGWYSLQKYVPSFTFVTGAVGYHIASWEAIHLRDPNSTEWCPSMLMNGITATLGAVAEPYLQAFPEPKLFFEQLLNGKCLAEAYYRTLPYNSWQIILIGDPLYKLKIKK